MTDLTDRTESTDRPDESPGPTTERTTGRPIYRSWTFATLGGAYRDSVSWGAIWGGLLTAIAVFLLLSVLGLAVGLTVVQRPVATPEEINRGAAVWSAVAALLAFLIGGFVAGRGGGIVGKAAGGLNGFLVWALSLLVVIVGTALGVGQLFGVLGGLGIIRELNSNQIDPAQVADSLRAAAWITFISMALAAVAATLGGVLGAEDDDEVVAEA